MGLASQLARRNLRRRPTEAALVVLGSLLGTAIITAAFIVGDSFDATIRDEARTRLGPIDEVVRVRPPTAELDRRLARLADRFSHAQVAGTDGLLVARTSSVVLSNGADGDRGRADPNACMMETSAAEARRFGPDPDISGFAAIRHSPADGTAIVNRATADRLRVGRDSTLVIHAYGQQRDLRITQVVDEVGVAGYCGAIVPAGTIVDLASSATAEVTAQPPSGLLLVSNDGGVFDSTTHSQRITAALQSLLDDPNGEVVSIKADRLKNAEDTGSSLQTLFTAVGGFSVMAGILLLINLFVMLAEERKVELGVLRAIGLKRSGVWRAFSLEGALYGVASAVLGAALGVGIGQLIIVGTNDLFSDPDDTFNVTLSARLPTLAIAAAIGTTISLLTVFVTSVRISRLNVISAVRDLPDPRSTGRRIGRLILSAIVVVLGGGTLVWGIADSSAIPLMAGVPLACVGLSGLLSRIASSRFVSFTLSAITIAWCLGVFVLFSDEMAQPSIGVFVLMGLVLVAAAVTIATTLDQFWDRITLALTERGHGLATRLALAYPLARRFRTGMLLGMFSLVIFTMTFMGAFAAILTDSTSGGVADVRAGFDLMVDSNAANPLTPTTLESRPEVADVAGLLRGAPKFTIDRYHPDDPTTWSLTGFDEHFLAHGAPVLLHRAPQYRTDRDAFEAVLADPKLIIVDAEFLQEGAAPADNQPRIDDRVRMRNGAGRTATARVVGVLRSDYTSHGTLVGKEFARTFLAPAYVENRMFVKLVAGQSPTAVARRLTNDLIDQGADAQTFPERVTDRLSTTTGFIRLMQVYLGFGLLIGIAGLGVVMVRAVRERRREIGMLRAMGVAAAVVRRAFLLEAAFIAVQAVLTGVGLGLLTADQVVVNSGAFSNASLEFTIPWLTITVIAVVPFIAALAATASPARRAARIRPAIALRNLD